MPTPVLLGFPGGSDGNESNCNVGDLGLIPELGRSSGGSSQRLEREYSLLRRILEAIHSNILAWRIPMDRGAWWAAVHGIYHKESDRTEQTKHTVPWIETHYKGYIKIHYTVLVFFLLTHIYGI